MKISTNPFWLLILAGPFLAICCKPGSSSSKHTVLVANSEGGDFAEYWYAGEGELNTFELEQSRYGEMRSGEAVMVFVTEPFSKSKQVKLDNPESEGGDRVSVMKLNHIRRFVTGVYDYSMMQSVFTPIDLQTRAQTLKTTTTSQDWCGQSYHQLNLKGEKYFLSGYSYFESEGDQTTKLKADLLEDELWTQIRIDPNNLKEGNYDVIPSSFYSRLAHDPLNAKQARLRFEDQGELRQLILEYLHLDRTLTIDFTAAFPHKIVSWAELQNGKLMSKGNLKASVKSAYWRYHDNRHEYLRDSLVLGK